MGTGNCIRRCLLCVGCELLADIDASCYVLDFHVSVATAEELELVYEPFYRILRAKRPGTPIVMATP
ncbi:SGNH/GDSL hydrolase family protein [Paenibacillus sp. J5C2022]|uniref:SGNH/GDSL hydrolase family protein n=1 Tax=Paenibacillus sp. J5C2022 TaxID=2977129 RepID=UPI00397BB192